MTERSAKRPAGLMVAASLTAADWIATGCAIRVRNGRIACRRKSSPRPSSHPAPRCK